MEEKLPAQSRIKKILKLVFLFIIILLLLPIGGLAYLSITSPQPDIPGVVDGKLPPCPDSPNCVCSFEDDQEHSIEPIAVEGDPAEFFLKLQEKTEQLARVRKVSSDENYVHYEFTTLIFRYVDDVEFLLKPEEKQVHVRSASRAGHSDLGVNRKRVEKIRSMLISE